MKKLKYENSWEADEYTINGEKVDKLHIVRIGDTEYDVFGKEVSVPYNDMGNTYHGTSIHYFIEVNVGGVARIPIDLNKIIRKTTVYAIEYELEGACPHCGKFAS